MAVIGNAPFQGLVSGGNILDASIEGVDLSTSAIAARLGYTPVDPGAAVFSANPTISSGTANGVAYLNASKVVTTSSGLIFDGTNLITSSAGILAKTSTARGNFSTDAALITQNGLAIVDTDTTYGQGYQFIRLMNSTAGYAGSISHTASTGIGIYSAADLILGANSAEKAKIDTNGNFKLNGGYMSFGDNGYIRADSAGWLQLQGGTSGTRIMNSSNAAALVTLDNAGNFQIGTTVGGAKLLVGSAETKSQNATLLSFTTSDTSNRFELIIARSTNAYYSIQSVEQNVGYKDIVFQQNGGSIGVGQTSPQEKLDVNGNIYIHTATGNPYLKIKTDGAGNNPWVRLQADTNYWDIQGTFSQTYDDLMFMYNGTNKMSFSTHSGGGLSIANSGAQLGRLTVDTNGLQHVVRGGGLNSSDYYYRFFKLFKLRTSASSGSSTEVKGRLHLSRVNEIGVSTMVDFFASQGYNSQIRVWYNRISGPDGATSFRFSTLSEGGSKYLCLEATSAPGWTNWQFEGSVVDYDGARGDFSVTASPGNLNWTETGPWTTPISNPGTPLLQDTDFSAYVVGVTNFDYLPSGTKTTVASTHIFGAPQTGGNFGEAMRITSNGSVGIGTSNPSTLLHVGRISTTTEGGQISFSRSSDNAAAWSIDVYGNTSSPILRFIDETATAERARFDSAGIFSTTSGMVTTTGQALTGTVTTDSSGNAQISISGWSWGDYNSYRRNIFVMFGLQGGNYLGTWIGGLQWAQSGTAFSTTSSSQSGSQGTITFGSNGTYGTRWFQLSNGPANTTLTYTIRGFALTEEYRSNYGSF